MPSFAAPDLNLFLVPKDTCMFTLALSSIKANLSYNSFMGVLLLPFLKIVRPQRGFAEAEGYAAQLDDSPRS